MAPNFALNARSSPPPPANNKVPSCDIQDKLSPFTQDVNNGIDWLIDQKAKNSSLTIGNGCVGQCATIFSGQNARLDACGPKDASVSAQQAIESFWALLNYCNMPFDGGNRTGGVAYPPYHPYAQDNGVYFTVAVDEGPAVPAC